MSSAKIANAMTNSSRNNYASERARSAPDARPACAHGAGAAYARARAQVVAFVSVREVCTARAMRVTPTYLPMPCHATPRHT